MNRGSIHMSRRRFRVLAVLASTFLVWASIAVVTDAASFKPYGIRALPGLNNAASGAVRLEIDNLTSTQQLGSIQVAVSSAFTITPDSSSGQSVGTAGTQATFQNLDIPAGGVGYIYFTIAFAAGAPCGPNALTWTFSAQQANQWQSGNTANYLTLAQVFYADGVNSLGTGQKAVPPPVVSYYNNTTCQYDLAGVPTAVTSGDNVVNLAVTDVTGGALNSVTVGVSSGYLISTSGGDVTTATYAVNLTAPGSSTTIPFTVKAPCASSAPLTWTFTPNPTAFNLRYVNGSPAPTTVTSTLTPACTLSFIAPTSGPAVADAEVLNGPDGLAVQTLSAGYPGAGAGVKVGAYDPNGHLVTDGALSISMELTGGTGSLVGTTPVTTVGGIATFPDLTVNGVGNGYRLRATNPYASSATSNPFNVVAQLKPCDPTKTTCTVPFGDSNSTTDSSSQITAQNPQLGNYFAGAFNPGNLDVSCSFSPFNYSDAYDPTITWYYYAGTSSTTKTVVLTIPKSLVQSVTNNGTSFYQICYGAPVTFNTGYVTGYDSTGAASTGGTFAVPIAPRSATGLTGTQLGAWTAGNNATDYFGTQWYVGLLPLCSNVGNTAPCLVSKAGTGGNRVITFITPAVDPFYK